MIVPAGRAPELRRVQNAFEGSRLFTRVAGLPGLDTLYRRTDAGHD